MLVGEKINNLRKRKGFSQELLAENAGISLRTIQRIEKGVSIPRPHTIKILADVLEVPVEELSQVESKVNQISPPDNETAVLQLMNLSAFAALILPFSNIILPLIIWKKHRDLLVVDKIGKRIISFQILWTLATIFIVLFTHFVQYSLTNSVAIGHLPPTIFLVYFILLIVNCVILIRAAIILKKDKSNVYSFIPALF